MLLLQAMIPHPRIATQRTLYGMLHLQAMVQHRSLLRVIITRMAYEHLGAMVAHDQ
jgi:hypothetical protein